MDSLQFSDDKIAKERVIKKIDKIKGYCSNSPLKDESRAIGRYFLCRKPEGKIIDTFLLFVPVKKMSAEDFSKMKQGIKNMYKSVRVFPGCIGNQLVIEIEGDC